jgi:acyltransferase-like protein
VRAFALLGYQKNNRSGEPGISVAQPLNQTSTSLPSIGAETSHAVEQPAAARPASHLDALDGLRGLAISLVLAEHFVRLHPTTLIQRLIATASQAGWVGVDLFFVLSGFLITGILLDAKGGERYFRNFYLRRHSESCPSITAT